MSDLQTQLAQIRQAIQTQESLRATLPAGQVETILAALRQQEATLQAQLAGSGAVAQGPQATALGERAAQVERAEIVITGDNNSVQAIIYHYRTQSGQPPDAAALRQQIGRYLAWLLDWAGTLELRGIQRQGEQVVQLSLETVYVPLAATVYRRSYEPKQGRPEASQQDVNLDEVLGLEHRLILTGGRAAARRPFCCTSPGRWRGPWPAMTAN